MKNLVMMKKAFKIGFMLIYHLFMLVLIVNFHTFLEIILQCCLFWGDFHLFKSMSKNTIFSL